MTRVEMNPNADRVAAALILGKANEAVKAVGDGQGRDATEIGTALDVALRQRGVNLPPDVIEKAATSIAAGERFEFR